MPIQPLTRATVARKDGQSRGASTMSNHTRLRLEDQAGAYVGLFDASNTYVTAVSEALEGLGLVVYDNVAFNAEKPASTTSALDLKVKK